MAPCSRLGPGGGGRMGASGGGRGGAGAGVAERGCPRPLACRPCRRRPLSTAGGGPSRRRPPTYASHWSRLARGGSPVHPRPPLRGRRIGDDLIDTTTYRTHGGLTVHRTIEPAHAASDVPALVAALDQRRGALYSSSYEYPGRYTRWDIGFVDPPLVLTSRAASFSVEAL